MKTKRMGNVLGISKQRNWWNRQSNRRTTEEQAYGRGKKRRKKRSGRVYKHRSSKKRLSLNDPTLIEAVGMIIELDWSVNFSKAIQLTSRARDVHKSVHELAGRGVTRVVISYAVTQANPDSDNMFTFFLPTWLAKRQGLAIGQYIKVGLRRYKVRVKCAVLICEKLRAWQAL